PATHSPTSVVLPKPAGAQTRVSRRRRPASSRASRRGRGTAPGRGGGRYSLVIKTGADIDRTLSVHPDRGPPRLRRAWTATAGRELCRVRAGPGRGAGRGADRPSACLLGRRPTLHGD